MEQQFNGIILHSEGHQHHTIKLWEENYYSLLCDGSKHPKHPEDVSDLSGSFFGHIEMPLQFHICWN